MKMAYLTESVVRQRAQRTAQRVNKSAGQVLAEAAPVHATFDIFLSHSSNEPEEILLGVKIILEECGFSVYVDKYSDPYLSPTEVTPRTAEILRGRMRQSNSLLYVHSQHSTKSRWMPWELGFFDGLKGTVGVLPVTASQEELFKGEEYLSLYPYVDYEKIANSSQSSFWINKSSNEYAILKKWINGQERILRR